MMIMLGLLAGKKVGWELAQTRTISMKLGWDNLSSSGIALMLKLYPTDIKINQPNLRYPVPHPILRQQKFLLLNLQLRSPRLEYLVAQIILKDVLVGVLSAKTANPTAKVKATSGCLGVSPWTKTHALLSPTVALAMESNAVLE